MTPSALWQAIFKEPGIDLSLSFDGDCPTVDAVEAIMDRVVRCTTDLDLAWYPMRLESARKIDCITPHVVVQSCGPDNSSDNRSGVDTHPESEVRFDC